MREVWRKFWDGNCETEGLVIAWTLIICGALVLASYYTSGGFGQLGSGGDILVLMLWVAIVGSTMMLTFHYFDFEGGLCMLVIWGIAAYVALEVFRLPIVLI